MDDEAGRPAGDERPGAAVEERVAPRWGLFAVALALLGLLQATAPYTADAIGLVVAARPIVEVVDHVVPAAVIVGIGLFVAARRRLPVWLALAAVLSALWSVVTHVPLLLQVPRGQVEAAAALWHALPGIALLVLSLGGLILARMEERTGAT